VRERRSSTIASAILCGAALLLLLWAALAGADSPTGTPQSHATLTPASRPATIADGPDGNLWFTETAPDPNLDYHIGTVTPTGMVAEHALTPTLVPGGLAPGVAGTPSGGLEWFDFGNADIGTLEALPTLTTTPPSHLVPLRGGSPAGVAADAGGNVWVAMAGSVDAVEEVASP
jgi:virginiamycin B lyase